MQGEINSMIQSLLAFNKLFYFLQINSKYEQNNFLH